MGLARGCVTRLSARAEAAPESKLWALLDSTQLGSKVWLFVRPRAKLDHSRELGRPLRVQVLVNTSDDFEDRIEVASALVPKECSCVTRA